MELQASISSEINNACIGQTFRVLVDRTSEDPAFDLIGRTVRPDPLLNIAPPLKNEVTP